MTLDRSLQRSNSVLTGRASAQAVQIAEGLRFASLQEAIDQMRSRTLPADLVGHFEALLRDRADGLLKGSADNLASEALALGRHDEAEVFAGDIEEAVYTSLLDENTCDPCAEADGTVVAFNDAEYNRLLPPYQDCKGGNRCRCQFVFTLRTEAPAGPIPITPLEPTPPYAPLPRRGFPVLPEEPPPAAPVLPSVEPLPARATPAEYASAILRRAVASEPAISANVQAVARETNGDMFGFEYRLKREASLERKIATEVHDLTASAVEPAIRDSIRYTTLYDAAIYTDKVRTAIATMESRGFALVRTTNTWSSSGYKGINTVWRAPNGQLFEMQYHTPGSVAVKENVSHPLYEKMRVEKDPAKLADYAKQIEDAWRAVPNPPGVTEIGTPFTIVR